MQKNKIKLIKIFFWLFLFTGFSHYLIMLPLYENNINILEQPKSSLLGDYFQPHLIETNQTKIISNSGSTFYCWSITSSKSLLFEINKSSCFNNIKYQFYDTDGYGVIDGSVIYDQIINLNGLSYFLIQNNKPKIFNFSTEKITYSCEPFINSSFTVYGSTTVFNKNQTYTKTLNNVSPFVGYIDIIKDRIYKVNFTQTLGKAMFIQFIYRENDTISRHFYNSTLFNNGYFQAKYSCRAMILLRSWHSGTYEFNFYIGETILPAAIIDGYGLIELMAILGTMLLIVQIPLRKKIKKV